MSKYIIKNCPAILRVSEVCNSYDKALDNPCLCKDCTDCVMKQIVKKCKKSLEVSYCPIEQEILELLDIREVE